MGSKIKTKILIFLSAVLFAFCGVLGVSFISNNEQAKAETGSPVLTIEKRNLSYSESVYILYAVSHEGFDRNQHQVKMLFWEAVQEEYTVDTAKTQNSS